MMCDTREQKNKQNERLFNLEMKAGLEAVFCEFYCMQIYDLLTQDLCICRPTKLELTRTVHNI